MIDISTAEGIQAVIERLEAAGTAKDMAMKQLKAALWALGPQTPRMATVAHARMAQDRTALHFAERAVLADLADAFAKAMEPMKVSMGAMDEALEALQFLMNTAGGQSPVVDTLYFKTPTFVADAHTPKTSAGSDTLSPAAAAALESYQSGLSGSLVSQPWQTAGPSQGPRRPNPV
jgi:hypothetical protein